MAISECTKNINWHHQLRNWWRSGYLKSQNSNTCIQKIKSDFLRLFKFLRCIENCILSCEKPGYMISYECIWTGNRISFDKVLKNAKANLLSLISFYISIPCNHRDIDNHTRRVNESNLRTLLGTLSKEKREVSELTAYWQGGTVNRHKEDTQPALSEQINVPPVLRFLNRPSLLAQIGSDPPPKSLNLDPSGGTGKHPAVSPGPYSNW